MKKNVTRVAALVLSCTLALSVSPVVAAKAKKPTLNKKSITIEEGVPQTLKVKKNGFKIKSVKWSSMDKSIATVTKKGVVKSVSAGDTKVKAKVKYTKKGWKKVKTITLTCKVKIAGEVPDGPVDGGWEICYENPEITEEHKAMVNSALNNTNDGVTYEPVALLATQVVAGTNYRFLCRKNVTIPEKKSTYSIVDIYKDLTGQYGVCISSGFEGKYDMTLPACSKEVVPGAYAPAEDPSLVKYSEVASHFNVALGGLVGATHTPIALVEQNASTRTYMVVCSCEIAGANFGDYPPFSFAWITITGEGASVTDIKNTTELDPAATAN